MANYDEGKAGNESGAIQARTGSPEEEADMFYQDAMTSSMQTDPFISKDWFDFLEEYHNSLVSLESQIQDASELRQYCTDEWCSANECMLGEITNAVFTIHEPHWTTEEDSRKLKELKKRVRNLYADISSQIH